jgi:hypothetical protein
MVAIAATGHFRDELFVPHKERFGLADPSQRFRVPGVSTHPAVLGQDVPQTMELAMLAEQMPAAKMSWMEIPNTHFGTSTKMMVPREAISFKLRPGNCACSLWPSLE